MSCKSKSTLESTSYIAKISRTTHIIQNMLFAKMDNSPFYISYEGSVCPWNAANIICKTVYDKDRRPFREKSHFYADLFEMKLRYCGR